jgi:hypothetical protein
MPARGPLGARPPTLPLGGGSREMALLAVIIYPVTAMSRLIC